MWDRFAFTDVILLIGRRLHNISRYMLRVACQASCCDNFQRPALYPAGRETAVFFRLPALWFLFIFINLFVTMFVRCSLWMSLLR